MAHTSILISVPRAASWLIVLLQALIFSTGYAHNGVDHGDDRDAAEIHRSSEPRFANRTDRTEVVGILSGQNLDIFIDDVTSNLPLDYKEVQVESDGKHVSATRTAEGHYQIPASWLQAGKEHHLVLTLLGDGRQDILATVLHVPESGIAHAGEEAWSPSQAAMWLTIMLLTIFTLWLVRIGIPKQRHARLSFDLTAVIILIVFGITVFDIDSIKSGMAASSNDGNPDSGLHQKIQRLSDGGLYVPKPAQRRLGIRTASPLGESQHRSHRLPGKVLADPSANANIVAELDGRLLPPDGGFPRPGQKVEKGQLLAYLVPIISPGELADKESELAFIERDLYLVRKQIERLKAQNILNQDNSVQMDIRSAELKGLLGKKKALQKMFDTRVAIHAPIAGDLGQADITAGQNVIRGTELFEIIDARHLWVEVINYDSTISDSIVDAYVVTNGGDPLPLEYIGTRSRFRGLGYPLLFKIKEPSHITPGELVNATISYGEPVQGISLDSRSVSIDEHGDTIIWMHVAPERFIPKVINRLEQPRADISFIVGDDTPTDPVVTAGASLLSAIP